ncbi:alpha/beta hydrolase [Streptomyces sp. NPDC003077]|uniref:alpha/beta fold hydrolase n=1 Tax=Streptomyces sp. NPDC003077 TaxID=3154443 RepID=UPI0033A68BC0
MTAIEHRFVEVNGIRLHIAEQGQGPLVVLLHGFPECWYSWRHQFAPLVAAGYRVVAPDQRGYARSDRPKDPASYTIHHLTGDLIGLIHALGEERAVVVGHDWGAPVAWWAARFRPDVVRGVVGLSVPPSPRGPLPMAEGLRQALGDRFYFVYFQEPGRADAELAQDIRTTFRRLLAGHPQVKPAPGAAPTWMIPEGGTLLDSLADPDRLPDWLTEADIDAMVAEYAPHGAEAFTGGLNWYRSTGLTWELTAAFDDGPPISVPAMYLAGEQDLVIGMPGVRQLLDEGLPHIAPRLFRSALLPDCGHWTQQEKPDEVNEALLAFLGSIKD